MTKPKGEKPARERAAKGDTSNEGAQWTRDNTRKAVRRLQRAAAARQAAAHDEGLTHTRAYEGGYIAACIEVLSYLAGQTERASVRPGGLKSPRGPGKGARRAQ